MYFFWILSTLVGALGGVTADQCRINPAASFSVMIASRRNLTGHWTLTVDAKRALSQSGQGGITVETAQLASSCGEDSDVVELMAITSVEPLTGTHFTNRSDVSVSLAQESTNISEISSPEPTEGSVGGYVGLPGVGYYKVHTEKMTWQRAKETCEEEGAHLMVIDSEVEAEIFRKLHEHHRDAIESTGWNNVQIGVYDPDNSGQFVTVLGDRVNSSRWYLGAPSTSRGSCGTALHDSLLYNWDCDAERAFICERITTNRDLNN
ncbi:hemolymph lipopolysaccharide-binding protein [Anabrus simplex]|uniref:hemolymph lipopolysaccharide-binding protein n=1 Tax=Anabrus simplex TaxID=316456 RepID=UPI0035A327C9